jgi:hypothetical protein
VHIHQSMWSTFEQMIPEGERWNTRSAFNIKHSTSSLSIKQTRARSSKNKTNLHTERHNNRRKSNATIHLKQTYSVVMILPVPIRWFVGCILHKQVYHMHTYEENTCY